MSGWLWKRIAFVWQVSKRLYWNSQDSELFRLCLPWKKGVRNTCVQVENPGMKIMFPPIGFQYLASEVQLEGKDHPLPALTAFSSGAPIPPQTCQAWSGQQAFSLCPNTEPAFLRSILRQWSPKCRDWKCTPSVAERPSHASPAHSWQKKGATEQNGGLSVSHGGRLTSSPVLRFTSNRERAVFMDLSSAMNPCTAYADQGKSERVSIKAQRLVILDDRFSVFLWLESGKITRMQYNQVCSNLDLF